MAVDPTMGATRTRPRRARLVIVIASALAVVTGLVVWLAVGRTPHLTAGSYGRVDLEAHWGPEGIGVRSIVTDPRDGTNDAVWSFRNTGHLPVEVGLASPQPAGAVLQDVGLFVFDPLDPFRNQGAASESVTINPGEELGVVVSVGFGCMPWPADSGVAVEDVALRVTTLGITRSITVRGAYSVGVKTTRNLPGTACD